MDPNMATVLVAAIPAAFAMLSASIVAFFQYREHKAKKAKEAEDADKEKAAAEKARADAAERQLREEHEQADRDRLQATLEGMQKQISSIESQVNHMSQEMNDRIEHAEESITAIVEILSKNARTMSQMMHMHAQTESRLQALMEIEGYNMRFTNETSTTLRAIGEIIAGALLDQDDAEKLNAKIEENTRAHKDFIDQIIEKQKDFFSEPLMQDDPRAEQEIKDIEDIIRRAKHKRDKKREDEEKS